MSKKRAKPEQTLPGEPAQMTAEEVTSTEPGNPNFAPRDDAQKKGKTLYLKLDADGNPEWSRMTARTLDAWRQIFNHPSTSSSFSTEAIPPEDRGAKEADASALLAWIGMGEAMFLSKRYSLSLEEALSICEWTPTERESLEPRIARVLNKYGGGFLAKYGDEIFLALTLSRAAASRLTACSSIAHDRSTQIVEPESEQEKKRSEQVVQ